MFFSLLVTKKKTNSASTTKKSMSKDNESYSAFGSDKPPNPFAESENGENQNPGFARKTASAIGSAVMSAPSWFYNRGVDAANFVKVQTGMDVTGDERKMKIATRNLGIKEAMMWFVMYSPIILVGGIAFSSFFLRSWCGLVFAGFFTAACVVRFFLFYGLGIASDSDNAKKNDDAMKAYKGDPCNKITYAYRQNATFSTFVFAFTCMYLFLPMMVFKSANAAVISILVLYFALDIWVKWGWLKCSITLGTFMCNLILGLVIALAMAGFMIMGKAEMFLFFNEFVSNKEMCMTPDHQTFKCLLYKDGEVVSEL